MTIYIEVGGHTGETASKWLSEDPNRKILILEPIPQLVKALNKKFEKNSNVEIFEVALWNKNEIRDFAASERADGSSLHLEKVNLRNPKIIKVECLRASKFINSLNEEIYLRLNCEGAEFEILEELLESTAIKKIKHFEIVYHHWKDNLDCEPRYKELIKKLEENNIKNELG